MKRNQLFGADRLQPQDLDKRRHEVGSFSSKPHRSCPDPSPTDPFQPQTKIFTRNPSSPIDPLRNPDIHRPRPRLTPRIEHNFPHRRSISLVIHVDQRRVRRQGRSGNMRRRDDLRPYERALGQRRRDFPSKERDGVV